MYQYSRIKRKMITFLLYLATLLLFSAVSQAATDAWTQTDWSGGSGTSTVDEYSSKSRLTSSTAGQLTVSTQGSWAYDEWSYRQSIRISNSGGAQTDYPVQITITYDDDMNADFSDLRFARGTTELSYWIQESTASTEATVWVNVDSLGASNTTIYMYYGNSSATDASSGEDTFPFFDDFSDGSLDTSKWTASSGATVTDGELVLTGSGSWNRAVYTTESFDRENLLYQVNMRWDSNNSGYDAQMVGWKDDTTTVSHPAFVHAFYQNGYTTCTTSCATMIFEKGSRAATIGAMDQGTDYQVRILLDSSAGADYYFRELGDPSWTSLYTTTAHNDTDLHPGFTYHSGEYAYDNVIVRPYMTTEPSVSNFGSEQGKYRDSGTLTSNIFDMGENNGAPEILEFTIDDDSLVDVKVRTGDETDLSDATDFSSCDAIDNGNTLSDNACVSNGHRYIQYQLTIYSSGSTTPTFEEITLNYDDMTITADAGLDHVVVAGRSINLDGTGSVGVDLDHSWGIFAGQGTLTNAGTSTPTYSISAAANTQTVTGTLSVYDTYDQRDSDTFTLNIQALVDLEYKDTNLLLARNGLVFEGTNANDQTTLTETTTDIQIILPENMSLVSFDLSDSDTFVLGLSEYDNNTGRVFVFNDAWSAMSGTYDLTDEDSDDFEILDGRLSGDRFGESVVASDFEDDGEDEIVVSAPGAGDFGELAFFDVDLTQYGRFEGTATTQAGSVFRADFLDTTLDDLIIAPSNLGQHGQLFENDLWSLTESGGVAIYSGETDFSGSFTADVFAPDTLISASTDIVALAIGDLNGDSSADIAISDADQNVLLFFGSFGDSTLDKTDADVTLTAGATETEFGASLAIAEVNGDSVADLVVGSPTSGSENAGGLSVVLGATSWEASMETDSHSSVMQITGSTDDDELGHNLLVTDSDASGTAEIFTRASSSYVYFVDLSETLAADTLPEETTSPEPEEPETETPTEDDDDNETIVTDDDNSSLTDDNDSTDSTNAATGSSGGCQLNAGPANPMIGLLFLLSLATMMIWRKRLCQVATKR